MLAGAEAGRQADPVPMAAVLTCYYRAVVVKLGADGALVASEGAEPERIAARSAVVRDTTGAGDAFCAGFLAAWLTGSPMTAAVRAAGAAAAVAVSGIGGRPRLADLGRVHPSVTRAPGKALPDGPPLSARGTILLLAPLAWLE